MDDALELLDYLPVSLKVPSEQEYVSFLWEAFEMNYAGEKYHFAFLAYHLLMMSFVYFNIWQIKLALPIDFQKSLIGFAREENELLKATSPFSFSVVNERTVLRFLRLIGCDNDRIRSYASLVDDRNKAAHPTGSILFRTQDTVDIRIRQVLQAVEEIQTHSQTIIHSCYREFLLQSHNADEREYPDAADQIREILIYENYLSLKDIEICINFDISALENTGKDSIRTLHNTLCDAYGPA